MTAMSVPTRLLIGVGTAAHLPCDLALPLPDGHPTGQPGLQVMTQVVDDVIVEADVRIGLMHRSMERLYEARDYRQLMMLANRQDWVSSAATELLIARAVEAAMGIEVPARAVVIRTLLAEAARASALLAFLAPVLPDHAPAAALREQLARAQERATGSRVHAMHARIGGVAADLDDATIDEYRAAAQAISRAMPRISADITATMAPFAGVAVLTRAQAIAQSLLGPIGRASGVALDTRVDDDAYAQVRDLLVPFGGPTDGDVPARYASLVHDLTVAATLVDACAEQLADVSGAVDVPLPKVVRVPEGTWMATAEGPLGRTSVVVVSTGDKTPWRLALRTPSFMAAQALGTALVGVKLADSAAAVMSFAIVPGDADR